MFKRKFLEVVLKPEETDWQEIEKTKFSNVGQMVYKNHILLAKKRHHPQCFLYFQIEIVRR
ncbi:MAG: hypothetical protein KC733_03895 [Candidatus Omnitrophica bacterium]|nr:hypothetical protein [Candidatus Omnitrophota bacterium]